MFPTDLAKIDLKKVRGIVIEKQNIQSHTSILIKSLKIPYLIKTKNNVNEIIDGQRAILDGFNGKLIVQPDRDTENKYIKHSKDSIKRIGSFKKKNKGLPDILASINTIEEARQASSMGVRGIGLFRTELSFLNGDIGLAVDDQFEAPVGDCFEAAYKKLYEVFRKNPEAKLVHAIVTGQGEIKGVQHGHAWVEIGDMVLDYSNGRTIEMPKQIYYAVGNVDPSNSDEYKTYSFKEMADISMDQGTYGPWELPKDSL